jgi:hypothetical protein
VQLKGREADRDGIGARVEVVVGRLRMIREIDGGSVTFRKTQPLPISASAGPVGRIQVNVIWPGGKRQSLLHRLPTNNSPLRSLESPFWHQWAAFAAIILLGAAVPLLLVGFYPKIRVRFLVGS